MYGSDVRRVTFLKSTRWGYPAGYPVDAVDDALNAAAEALHFGRPVQTGELKRSPKSGSYSSDAVDCFFRDLGQLSSSLARGRKPTTGGWYEGFVTNALWRLEAPEDGRLAGATVPESPEQRRKRLEQECNEAWERFPELVGTHLKLDRVSSRGWELIRSEDGLALASTKGARWADRGDIAQIEFNGAIYRRTIFPPWRRRFQWVNVETKSSILRGAGVNSNHRARMAMELPDGRRFRFPVRGTETRNAVMTAVDDKGDRVARFRSARGSGLEAVVAPHVPITTEVLLVVAASSQAVLTYFHVPQGGGA
jgi:hypothetical protein